MKAEHYMILRASLFAKSVALTVFVFLFWIPEIASAKSDRGFILIPVVMIAYYVVMTGVLWLWNYSVRKQGELK